MKKICLILSLFCAFSAFAADNILVKKGKIVRVDEADYVHCIFVPEGEKEEMDLWPRPVPKINCKKFLKKNVTVTIRPEKLKVPEMGGTMDILRLLKIETP